jgi:hypothetical protein
MCDNCGDIFSVNSAGWNQYTMHEPGFNSNRASQSSGNTIYNNPHNHGAITRHTCGDCNKGNGGVYTPSPRLNGPIDTIKAVAS